MKKLAILGASGHGMVVAEIAEACGWESIVFFDDAWPNIQVDFPWKIIGNTEKLLEVCSEFSGVSVAIGNNVVRNEKIDLLLKARAPLCTLVHPTAVISPRAVIGDGSVIMANVVVDSASQIGTSVILNTACNVNHDCILGDSVHISPGASLAGGVRIGKFSWVGIGACIIQNISVGENALIAAGSVVVSDVTNGSKVMGCPAKPL